MNWYLLREIGFVSFLFLTILFVSKKKYHALMALYFFSFPFQNFALYFLTSWNPYKIVSIGMLLLLCKDGHKVETPNEIRKFANLIYLLLFISSCIGLVSCADLGYKGMVRLIAQDITYLLGIVPLYYVKLLKIDSASKMFYFYKCAISLTIIIGIIHYLFLKFGISFAPIFRDVGKTNDVATNMFGGSIVYRVYGFCGEPKNMAFYIAPFALSMMAVIMSRTKQGSKNALLFFLSIFILVNTYSSAAFIETIIGLFVVMTIFRMSDLPISSNVKLLLSVLFVVAIWYIVYSFENDLNNFVTSFYDRSFGRAQTELEEGRFETIIMTDFWNNNPLYWFFGYGAGMYSFHSLGMSFARGYNPVQSGLVLNIVDFGILGYIVFTWVLFFLIKLLSRIKIGIRYGLNEPLYFYIAGIATLIGNMMYCMMGGNILTGMSPFIALAYWYSYNQEKLIEE